MTENHGNSSLETRQHLVAWLDGELDDAGAREMERLVARDPGVRRNVSQLLRTWELLDELDVVRASEQFTQRTMTSIQAARTRSIEDETGGSDPGLHLRDYLSWAAWLFALFLAALVGFEAAHRRSQNRSDDILENLPIVERRSVCEAARRSSQGCRRGTRALIRARADRRVRA